MTTPEKITQSEVREILHSFQQSGWTAMTLEINGMRVAVGKNGPPSVSRQSLTPAPPPKPTAAPPPAAATTPPTETAAAPAPAATSRQVAADDAGLVAVVSPVVGTFWASPSPGQPPFVQAAQTVDADQQLGIVEVMKLMNPVLAPQAGEIVQVCVKDADAVEFDQPLFLIRPESESSR